MLFLAFKKVQIVKNKINPPQVLTTQLKNPPQQFSLLFDTKSGKLFKF